MEKDIYKLIEKYEAGECTSEERRALEDWYCKISKDQTGPDINESEFHEVDRRLRAGLKINIISEQKPAIHITWRKLSVAAAVIAVFVVAAMWYFHPFAPSSQIAEIKPGTNRATLKLEDGSIIPLDSLKEGEIAQQGNIKIKNINGQIEYEISGESQSKGITYNTITTPRGGQYKLRLSDGTLVYLNAGSSLTYPTTFAHLKERRVKLEGEGYFEVAKKIDATPFFVISPYQSVQVTGTHFNVVAYPNEPVSTTLAEGSVIVSTSTGEKKSLIPGQQSTLTTKGIIVKDVNPNDFISWKDNLFVFNSTPLQTALLQISRWYDVQVDIDFSSLPAKYITGEIPRTYNLPDVLRIIDSTSGVKLTLAGRRIMIN